jgi:hypothetical protein
VRVLLSTCLPAITPVITCMPALACMPAYGLHVSLTPASNAIPLPACCSLTLCLSPTSLLKTVRLPALVCVSVRVWGGGRGRGGKGGVWLGGWEGGCVLLLCECVRVSVCATSSAGCRQ